MGNFGKTKLIHYAFPCIIFLMV